MKLRINLCWVVLLTLCSCTTKSVVICEIENNRHVGVCEQIANQAYIYAILSANSYETAENTPFILPKNIREVRHADSQVSDPGPQYVDSKVYDNGSFQAKVFEIRSGDPEDGADILSEVVIAYRGTEKFPVADLIDGTLTHNHRIKALRLYEEIKDKYATANVKISLTGHSLGGALALEVAYTYNEVIIDVYAFNTSYHITFWKKLKTLPKSERVISIEERYDAVVGPPKILWKTPEGLHIYKFNYVNTLILGNHSRYRIALGLLKEAQENGSANAAQNYNTNQKLYQE